MEQRHVNLSHISTFVLDEADRMLDMGFIQPIRQIASVLPKAPARQTLLFSATMPREIMHLADSLLHTPVKVSVAPTAATIPSIEQSVYMVPRTKKQSLLRHLLENPGVQRAIVFTKTKHGADRLCKQLNQSGVNSDSIHGNKAQNQRQRALDGFRTGRTRVLVATDVAARGIDVDAITHVFNFDLPMEPEAYVHRIGRTARAGAKGIAISFCDREEFGLLRSIERLMNKRLPQITTLPQFADHPSTEVATHAATRPAHGPAYSHVTPRSGSSHHSAPHAPHSPHAHRAGTGNTQGSHPQAPRGFNARHAPRKGGPRPRSARP
jgi:ATP-dependent RNA helicase RhlE